MLDWRITSHHPSDTLGTCIRYCSADLYNTYTMYHPPDVRWHVLNDTMSQYYLCHHRIFGLNALILHAPTIFWRAHNYSYLWATIFSCLPHILYMPWDLSYDSITTWYVWFHQDSHQVTITLIGRIRSASRSI